MMSSVVYEYDLITVTSHVSLRAAVLVKHPFIRLRWSCWSMNRCVRTQTNICVLLPCAIALTAVVQYISVELLLFQEILKYVVVFVTWYAGGGGS